MGSDPTALVTKFLDLLSGPFGLGLMCVLITIALYKAMISHDTRHLGTVIGCAAGVACAHWGAAFIMGG